MSDENANLLRAIREILDSKINYERQIADERDRRYETIFRNSERSVELALSAIGARLDLLNESRQTISDLTADKPTRLEIEVQLHAIQERLDAITSWMHAHRGSGSGMSQMWGWVFGAVSLLASVLIVVMMK